MVRMPVRLAALDRKLLRDLWEMKGQALAIAAVIGAGVVMFVAFSSNFESLRLSQGIFYEQLALRRCLCHAQARAREARGADSARFRASKPLRRASSQT